MNKKSLIITAVSLALFTCVGAIANENLEKANFGPKPIAPHHKQFKGGPNPEVMKQRMVEFEQKLQLTDEQKEKLKKNHEKSREKMKKIIEQEKKLQEQKHKIMKENKEYFESVLTDEQKETLKQMHEERIKEWKEKHKNNKEKGDKAKPLPIKPKTEKK